MQEIIDYVKTILPSIHGWCTPDKAAKFIEFIVQNRPDTCVEIGVFGGSSLIPQALALKHNKKGVVYGIDPWSKDSALQEMTGKENAEWWGQLDLEGIYQHCVENIDKYDVKRHCKLIRDKSENVIDRFQDESIDLLYIDGNHSELLSYNDSVSYLPKVKKNGTIFFDDIWWTEGDSYVTTRKAIMFLNEHCQKIDLVDDCMILRKK